MKITLITVGKIKENYYKEAIKEYSKRLSRYCKLEIIVVTDEKTPDLDATSMVEKVKQIEEERILSKIKDNSYVIALAIEGKTYNSVDLAKHIDQLGVMGRSNIVYVIGGSLGLGDHVLKRANETLSFSNLTFPHQLMRVILLEQIYRSYRIINNEPYHK